MQKIGSTRRAQLVGTYGIGSIIAIEDESFMIAGLDFWMTAGPFDLPEKRLATKLGVEGFRRPPATGKSGRADVPVVRFPMQYSCAGECDGTLLPHRFFVSAPTKNRCTACSSTLTPSRFVVACEAGHIDDFPYFAWLHQGMPDPPNFDGRSGRHRMKMTSAGGTASLSDITISCSCGVPPRTMEGAFSKNALKGVRRCSGARPWLGDRQECELIPRALQRGASNVYFSVTESALSIPPWSEGIFKVLEGYFSLLDPLPDEFLETYIEAVPHFKGLGFSPKELADAVRARKQGQSEAENAATDLREQEYTALLAGKAERSREQDFVCQSAPGADAVEPYFSRVMQVTRLREVVALRGFTRLLPLSPTPEDAARMAPLSREKMSWLPAVEVRGEGVFFQLNEARLAEWEARPAVCKRAARLDGAMRRRFASWNQTPTFTVTPRLVLIHTLAHALIGQWALDCGYPAGSLRERLYVSDPGSDKPMAGFLIYTASSDAAGSLGGVCALGEGERLHSSLHEAIRSAAWCSADPLCLESDAAGTDGLNLAACHACVLLPETSCERSNTLLDRALLIGELDNGDASGADAGFFADLL